MAVTQVTLNGSIIQRPWPFKIERYKISTLERMSDGGMVGDFIARKRTFTITYAQINSTELNRILDIIWLSDSMFFTLTWVEDNVVYTTIVYPGAIPQTLHHTGSEWIWQDISFQLIEK